MAKKTVSQYIEGAENMEKNTIPDLLPYQAKHNENMPKVYIHNTI